MNEFDSTIILFFNQYAHISTTFDKFIVTLSSNHLLKGGVIASLMWYVLFNNLSNFDKNKFYIIASIISTIISLSIARGLSLILQMRLRPLHEQSIDFILPYGIGKELLDGWNSMPSDHATLFFTLSIGLYFTSKRIGLFALFYTVVFICIPRVYLGLHYPTDLIVGAIIGIIVSYIVFSLPFFIIRINKLIRFSAFHSGSFYSIIFLFTYQIADMFDTTRDLLKVSHMFFKSIGLY